MEHLESYFSKVKKQLTSKEDALAILFHWGAIFNNLKCAGIGENRSRDWEVINSDIPPENWNSDQSCYLFRYLDENKNRFLLKITKSEQFECFFMHLKNLDVLISSINLLKIDEYVGDSFLEFKTAYKEDVNTVALMMKGIIRNITKSPEENPKASLPEK